MKVNERRTVVEGWLTTVCPPQPWREIDAHAYNLLILPTVALTKEVILFRLWFSSASRYYDCFAAADLTRWNSLRPHLKQTNIYFEQFV